MANTVTNTNNLSLRSILEKDKLTGANFLDWERNLMIVLRHERKWYVLEEPLGEAPPANATANVRNAYRKNSDDLLDLRDMFQTQARAERYDATRALNACKMAKGTSVSDHVMKMKRHIDHLERLGHPVPLQLATDTILNSLTEDYKQFVINYNMNNMEKTIAELHSMLKTAKLSMGTGTKTKDVLMVGDGGAKRKRRHGNTSKGKSQPQASQSVTKVENNDKRKCKGKKVKPNKTMTENRCFKCHEIGHWRHNYPKHREAGSNASGLNPTRRNSVWSFTGGFISSNPDSPTNNLQLVVYQPPKQPTPEPTPQPTPQSTPEPENQANFEFQDVNFGSVTGEIIHLMENSRSEAVRTKLSKMTFRVTPLNPETTPLNLTRFNSEASSSRTPEIQAPPETVYLSSDDEFISDDFSTPASSPRSPPSNSHRSEGENYPDTSTTLNRDGRLDAEEYDEAIKAQEEHNKKQKEAFLSAQAARRLASDFVEEDDEISADPLLAQKAALKVFNRNAEEQAEEVNTELDWCRDHLHLRKHGAAISGIRLRRTRGKRDRYNLSEWNEIRSLLPKANKNYRAEVEEVINGLIARIIRTTEIPDELLQPSSAQPMPPVRRSAGTSTRRPTPCLPRTIIKPLDLSMLDLSFPSGVSLSEGQVIREPVHGICVSDNSKNLRFQRFSELHKAPYEHLVSVLFIAQKERKTKTIKKSFALSELSSIKELPSVQLLFPSKSRLRIQVSLNNISIRTLLTDQYPDPEGLVIMENNFQPTLQQQLAAAQQQVQQLANQNMEANNEIVRLRGLNPQVSQTNPAISAPLPRPPPVQQHQFRTPQAPSMPQASQIPNNQSQTIFPPFPSGPPPVFTYVQPQGVPRPFYSIPEPIPHIPTINTTVTHIPVQPNYQGNIGVTPTESLMDVRLKMLEEQNKAMLALLAKLPGAAVPVQVEPKTGFQASPYVDEIALMEIPKKYNIPAFTTKYSGITDPVEHVAQYKQLMWTASIPSQYQEACMCKSFGSTLTGAALQWLINLKPKSIESFAELVNQFTRQFASSRKMEKQTSDLYYVVQKTGETIRDYFNRFNAEMIEVKNCDIKTAIEAYKRGLDNSSELYTDLTKYPPENFDDVRARTLAHMRIEDDAIFRWKHSNEKKNLGAQKHDFKPKRVNKIGNSRQESKTRTSKGTGRIRYPDLSTYNFAGTSKELVDSLRKIDANVRWPKKPENPSKDKDQTKWCEFHADHGHTTDECISLKKEIAYLKTNGHLKGIIGDEAKRPASPIHTKVVNCITGGSEVCGLTYSVAKRHAREGPEGYPIPEDSKTAAEKELDTAKLTFDQDDLSGVNQKHHDALVIQLTIGNCLTKRVLVDGGSSANVIFSDTLKIMGIDRSNIVRRTTTLVGFNGDATSTLGEIVLPVFAKGINKQTKFNVIDCPSAYNAILGRPWIHDMKAVPSTYHQKIKFPSPWGVQEIVSEKKIARECYKITMKTKPQDI
ncbi:hypothetical protein OSB04_002374 [Centaurea solstitialis]|uniref:Retrotransposon gag domain-containing protein n=1 Tax=Centaurea solstitialis TaxID=347529 RepID=A0AA38UBA1_9ASTR|nr:hypothetical protein OSB04_002374 [Centaurea solstitialis]